MNHRLRDPLLCSAMIIASVYASPARADLTASQVCSYVADDLHMPNDVALPNACYSTFACEIGMRGKWLDLTTKVVVSPDRSDRETRRPPSATGSVTDRGASGTTQECVPKTSSFREGWILVNIRDIQGSGRMNMDANRPGPLGLDTHTDSVTFDVRDGTHYLEPFPRTALTARVGQTKVIEIAGRGLDDLRLKRQPAAPAQGGSPASNVSMKTTAAKLSAQNSAQLSSASQGGTPVSTLSSMQLANLKAAAAAPTAPTPEVTMLGKTARVLRLEVKFNRQGLFSLSDYVEFSSADPAINKDFGWPVIDVKP